MSAAKYKILSPCAITSADGESTVLEREFGKEVTVPNKVQAEALVAGGFLEPVAESRAGEVPPETVQPGETEADTVLVEVDVEPEESTSTRKSRKAH